MNELKEYDIGLKIWILEKQCQKPIMHLNVKFLKTHDFQSLSWFTVAFYSMELSKQETKFNYNKLIFLHLNVHLVYKIFCQFSRKKLKFGAVWTQYFCVPRHAFIWKHMPKTTVFRTKKCNLLQYDFSFCCSIHLLHMCHLLCNRLFFESLPQEAATNNLCNGYKKWKEQVTMHFYCTASGNGKLLKLVVSILKMSCLNYLTPHPFPHPLPFFTVRMTHNLFKEWLLNTEKKMNSLKNWSYTYSLITLFL